MFKNSIIPRVIISARKCEVLLYFIMAFVIALIMADDSLAAQRPLGNTGPSGVDGRYNLSTADSHPYSHNVVPVYFEEQPKTDVWVKGDWIYSLNGAQVAINGRTMTPSCGGGDVPMILSPDCFTFTLPASSFYKDAGSGHWRSDIVMDLVNPWGSDNPVYQFAMRIFSRNGSPDNGIIAYAGGSASQADKNYWMYGEYTAGRISPADFVKYQYNTWRGTDQTIPMALPCTITQPVTRDVILRDLDQPRYGSDNNPTGGINGGRNITATVLDETTGISQVYYGPHHYDQMTNGRELRIPVNFVPGHKYLLIVSNIWVGNLLEYEIPFDNIAYMLGCSSIDGQTEIRQNGGAWSTSDINVRPGSNVDWRHTLKNGDSKAIEGGVLVHSDFQMGDGSRSNWDFDASQGDTSIDYGRMNAPGNSTFFQKITPAYWVNPNTDIGKRICRRAAWLEGDGSKYGWLFTNRPCAIGQYHYPGCDSDEDCVDDPPNSVHTTDGKDHKEPGKNSGVQPHTYVESTTVDPGQPVKFSYDLKNSRGPTKSKSIKYKIYTFVATKDKIPKNGTEVDYGDYGFPSNKEKAATYEKNWDYDNGQGLGCEMKTKSKGWVTDYYETRYRTEWSSWTDSEGNSHSYSYQVPYQVLKHQGHTTTGDVYYQGRGMSNNDEPFYREPDINWDSHKDPSEGVYPGPSDGRAIVNDYISWCDTTPIEGTVDTVFMNGTVSIGRDPFTAPAFSVKNEDEGPQVCSFIAIDENWSVHNGSSSNSYLASNIACVKISKQPTLHLTGADSYAYRGFDAMNFQNSSIKGSWGQYGLQTGIDSITNFGSAAFTTWGNRAQACKLAYANTDSLSGSDCANSILGDAGIRHVLSKPIIRSENVHESCSVDTGSGGIYMCNGDVSIGGQDLTPGKRTIVLATGDVNINGNITGYGTGTSGGAGIGDATENRTFKNPADVPSLIILTDGDIKVKSDVELITGVFGTMKGKFDSCADVTAEGGESEEYRISGGKCSKKLKVVGAVISQKTPHFTRTFGNAGEGDGGQWSNDSATASAEWIHYSPATWLSVYLSGDGTINGYRTANVKSLPIRY